MEAAVVPGRTAATARGWTPFRHRPARIQDVAAAAGVSVSTVSNVLNRPERVTERTAERVRVAVAALDYVPHPGAAGLRTGHSSAIGLVLPDVTNSFYARIARGAADAAYDHGYSLVLCHSGDAPEREQGYFSMLPRAAGRRCAVVVPLSADPGRLARLRERGIPLVLADRAMPDREGCSASVDDIAGGRIAVTAPPRQRGTRHPRRQRRTAAYASAPTGTRAPGRPSRSRREARLDQVVAERMTVAGRHADRARASSTCPTGSSAPTTSSRPALLPGTDRARRADPRGRAGRRLRRPRRRELRGDDPDDGPPTGRGPRPGRRGDAVDEIEARADHLHETRVFAPGLVLRDSTRSLPGD